MNSKADKTLGFVSTMTVYQHAGRISVHVATGRVVDALAPHFQHVYLCGAGANTAPTASTDLNLEASNVEVIPQPLYKTTFQAIKHIVGITRAYWCTVRQSDAIVIRGMVPYVVILYLLIFLFRRPVCHWIVGNAIALLRTTQRRGHLFDRFALLYAWQDRIATRLGRWATGGSFVCNGAELGEAYASPRTVVTASSTVRDDEFFEREDTCQDDPVRIIFVGYIRPEKGVEYLLRALPLLQTGRPWELVLVGPDQYPAYRQKLDEIIAAENLGDRLTWAGYVSFGEPMYTQLRQADLLVLPTLSEGTPHVLVEARASSLPIVSTNVGGVPTTVTDGHDALLVPPRDPQALATAIDKIIDDGELRRRLIRNGIASARALTVSRFAELIMRNLGK